MTTPTREQVIGWAKEAGGGLSCIAEPLEHPWKFTEAELIRLATIAMSAGREQGLREAKEVCEHNTGTPGDCADAIDQLRTKP